MSIIMNNTDIPGIQFFHGIDVTSDMLTGLQQYISTELTKRSRDFIKMPGFVNGLQIGDIRGQSITITQGSAIDQNGIRLYQPRDISYRITLPTGQPSGYLCIRAYSSNASYKVHPYDGTRKPTETVMGIEVFVDTSVYLGVFGNDIGVYPSANNGIVLCMLIANGLTYDFEIDPQSQRSPNIKMMDGSW